MLEPAFTRVGLSAKVPADLAKSTDLMKQLIDALNYMIDDLVTRRPGAVQPALTSRDIATLKVLPEDARAAFARLAQAVERTFFGGRPSDADAFSVARADYQAFAFAEGWR